MNRWYKARYKAIILIALISILVFLIVKYVMASDRQDNTPKYRVERVTPPPSKLRLSREALQKLERKESLVATIKVSRERYVPSGVEVRTWISPFIFTAKIPYEVVAELERDPAVVSLEPAYNLRSH